MFLSMGEQTQREELADEGHVYRYTPLFALLIFLPILLMAVWGPPRSDTSLYLSVFETLPSNLREGWKEAVSSNRLGFVLLGVIVKILFGAHNTTAYRLVISLIHAIPIITINRRYSDDYWFSIYLFVASSMHLAWMMNGLRQFIAVSIIFMATPWLIEKKYMQVICAILLAATFHNTALFMIPVVFIVQGEIWNWKTILFSVIAVLATFIFVRNVNVFNEFSSSIGYSIEWARNGGDDGVNPLRVLVNSIPMAFSFVFRNKIRDENSKIINICVNMSVITTGIYLIGMVTSGIMVGRMPIYTSLYNLILLPHIINTYFEGNNSIVIKSITIIMYFIYFYVQRGF